VECDCINILMMLFAMLIYLFLEFFWIPKIHVAWNALVHLLHIIQSGDDYILDYQ
jgi:hypothetical protein